MQLLHTDTHTHSVLTAISPGEPGLADYLGAPLILLLHLFLNCASLPLIFLFHPPFILLLNITFVFPVFIFTGQPLLSDIVRARRLKLFVCRQKCNEFTEYTWL